MATVELEAMNALQRDLGRLEGTVEAQGASIAELRDEVRTSNEAINAKLDRVLAIQEQQRGAKRFGVWLVGLVSGGIVAAVLEWLKKHP